jgi:hypothetical protein
MELARMVQASDLVWVEPDEPEPDDPEPDDPEPDDELDEPPAALPVDVPLGAVDDEPASAVFFAPASEPPEQPVMPRSRAPATATTGRAVRMVFM